MMQLNLAKLSHTTTIIAFFCLEQDSIQQYWIVASDSNFALRSQFLQHTSISYFQPELQKVKYYMEKTLQSVITFYLILPHFPLLGILQQTPHPKNSSVVCVTWVDRNRGGCICRHLWSYGGGGWWQVPPWGAMRAWGGCEGCEGYLNGIRPTGSLKSQHSRGSLLILTQAPSTLPRQNNYIA